MTVGQPAGSDDSDDFQFKAEVQVRFRDLDPMNHVNNAVYLTYFEIARLAYWSALRGQAGTHDREMIVAEVTCTYRSPATLNERLTVWVRIGAIRRSSFIYRYRIVEQTTGRLIATGRSVQVLYDYDAGRAVPMSPELRARIEAVEGRPLGPDEE